MAFTWFDTGRGQVASATINLVTDSTIRVALVGSTYIPNTDDDVVDTGSAGSIFNLEVNGTGYSKGVAGTGRKLPTTRAWSTDKTNNRNSFKFDNIAWTSINGFTIGWALLMKQGATDTVSIPIAAVPISPVFVANGGTWTLEVDPSGFFWVTGT